MSRQNFCPRVGKLLCRAWGKAGGGGVHLLWDIPINLEQEGNGSYHVLYSPQIWTSTTRKHPLASTFSKQRQLLVAMHEMYYQYIYSSVYLRCLATWLCAGLFFDGVWMWEYEYWGPTHMKYRLGDLHIPISVIDIGTPTNIILYYLRCHVNMGALPIWIIDFLMVCECENMNIGALPIWNIDLVTSISPYLW